MPPENPPQDGAVVPAQLADQVLQTLRSWIINGDLAPGDRLPIRDIAARVGTSVMPVREAVRALEESGLVSREPYRGAVVRGLSVAELEQVYDVRILLEGDAARRGAVAANADAVEAMEEHWRQLEAAALEGRVSDALAHDEQLLLALFEAGGNSVAIEIIRDLWNRCRPYKVLWASTGEMRGGAQIWNYKPKLIDAARQNDGPAAERALRDSYRKAKRELERIVEPDAGAGT